jgi:hypothetical protein
VLALRRCRSRGLAGVVDALIEQTYRAAYNLEEALTARSALALAPQMSAAHRDCERAVIAFLRGAVTLDHYFGGVADGARCPKPAPISTPRVQADDAKGGGGGGAAAESEGSRAKNDNVRSGVVCRVSGKQHRVGVQGRDARYDEEKPSSRESQRSGATFIVGTCRYLIGSSAAVADVRVLVGFGGGKEKGLAMVETAKGSGAARRAARASFSSTRARADTATRFADDSRARHRLSAQSAVRSEGARRFAPIEAGRPDPRPRGLRS